MALENYWAARTQVALCAGCSITAWRITGRKTLVQIFINFCPVPPGCVSHRGRTCIADIRMAAVRLIRRISRVPLPRSWGGVGEGDFGKDGSRSSLN